MKHLLARIFFPVAPLLLLTAVGRPADHTLDIYWVDVEGGGGTLIVTPAGESVLIDSGNPGVRDAGRIHQTATQVAGLKKIDHYVTTHFHTDHFGGVAALSALIPIGQVYDNGIPQVDPDGNLSDTRWPLLIKPYREFQADQRHIITPGQVIKLKQPVGAPKLTLRCVARERHGAVQAFEKLLGRRGTEREVVLREREVRVPRGRQGEVPACVGEAQLVEEIQTGRVVLARLRRGCRDRDRRRRRGRPRFVAIGARTARRDTEQQEWQRARHRMVLHIPSSTKTTGCVGVPTQPVSRFAPLEAWATRTTARLGDHGI